MKNKPKIIGTRFVLAVNDLQKSADYYRQQLGFTSIWSGEDWHFLKREKFVLMLGECPEDKSAFEINNHSYFAYIEVASIATLYKEFIEKDIVIISELQDKSWGQREFLIQTIDGHRIMFGEEVKP